MSTTFRPPIGKIAILIALIGIASFASRSLIAQVIPSAQIGFDRPESWALKRFDAALLPEPTVPAAPADLRSPGNFTLGIETDWLPMLSAAQQTVGFDGTKLEDLNKAPVLIRPILAVELPAKFRFYAFAPPPISIFGIKPRLFALGVSRPLLDRGSWKVDWMAYAQGGSVKGAFTCPESAVEAPPGSPANPTDCVALSSDIASLHYGGGQIEVAHPLTRLKLVPHASVAGTYASVAFRTHAPITTGLSQTYQSSNGGLFSTAGGVTYLFNQRIAFTVDVFYSPLYVSRSAGAPVTNDGLFNVRGILSYHFGSAVKQH